MKKNAQFYQDGKGASVTPISLRVKPTDIALLKRVQRKLRTKDRTSTILKALELAAQ
jgi:hypothetical protein